MQAGRDRPPPVLNGHSGQQLRLARAVGWELRGLALVLRHVPHIAPATTA